jgi:hypothetical protein
VNQHLAAARERARRGEPYVLQVPLAEDEPAREWQPALVTYWKNFGDRIGTEVAPIPVPPSAGRVRLRAVSVRPDIVLSIAAQDVNIVLERLEATDAADRFDLIVATNILVYYNAFEQALAMSNVEAMLKPGAFLLANVSAPDVRSVTIRPVDTTTTTYARGAAANENLLDFIVWYQAHAN